MHMKKRANAVSIISGADGPTSVFVVKKNHNQTLRHKLRRFMYKMKRVYVEKTLKAESHSIDEVIEYIVNTYGFVEIAADEYIEEYDQMRASFMLQHAPELLGEYAEMPQLESESPEDVQLHLKKIEERVQKATEIPRTVFDIDFHKFKKSYDDINDNVHILIEKNYAYIGGGTSGNEKVIKEFRRIYKDVYRYYGVTQEDIKMKSARYQDVVRTLSMWR